MPLYKVISYLTFPGIVLHETAHLLACWFSGTKVKSVRFFRFDGGGGDVTHLFPNSYIKMFFIALCPLVVNTFLSYLLLSYTFSSLDTIWYLFYLKIWAGFCFALHSLPSIQDANSLLEYSKNLGGLFGILFFIISLPIFIIFWILNHLRGIGIELFWALFILYISYNQTVFDLIIKYIQNFFVSFF